MPFSWFDFGSIVILVTWTKASRDTNCRLLTAWSWPHTETPIMYIMRSPENALEALVREMMPADDPNQDQALGMLSAVFTGLVKISAWANWIVIQPDLTIHASEEYPTLSAEGWIIEGQSEHCGAVAKGEWACSLRSVPKVHGAHSKRGKSSVAIHNLKRLMPDDSVALTMDKDGTVIAWKETPQRENSCWQSRHKDSHVRLGEHAFPAHVSWQVLYYVNPYADAMSFPGGAIQ